jgi:xanthine dehydrogenase accessory factor
MPAACSRDACDKPIALRGPTVKRGGGRETRPVVLVLGADDIGSAIGVAIHRAGASVVLLDDVDPCWSRRGMSFTDAWYLGSARLDGTDAVFCASARSVPTLLDRDEAIVATTWSWRGILGSLLPVAVVDARPVRVRGEPLRGRVPPGVLTVGAGPDFVVGEHVDVAVETAPGDRLGEVVYDGATRPKTPLPPMLGGVGRERFVHATMAGRFFTRQRIGDAVTRNDWIGVVGTAPIRAPISGVLRGLSARGARVVPDARVVEVDPRGDPTSCFGIGARARTIADGVQRALAPVAGSVERRLR